MSVFVVSLRPPKVSFRATSRNPLHGMHYALVLAGRGGWAVRRHSYARPPHVSFRATSRNPPHRFTRLTRFALDVAGGRSGATVTLDRPTCHSERRRGIPHTGSRAH